MSSSQHSDAKPQKSLNIFGQPLTIFGVPVDRETIFSNHKGVYKSRVEKRQRKLIVKTAFIKFFLDSDERIFCLTTGYAPITILEQALTGAAFLYFKRAILVFTNKRLLHIPMLPSDAPSRPVSQILYEDCAKLEIKGRSLVVQYKTHQQESFPYIGRKEKKKIKTLLTTIPLEPKEAGRLNGRVYLCPSCTNVLGDKKTRCQVCRLKFKSKVKATLAALLIPGGGYFYSRFPLLGILFAAVELLLMGFLVFHWIDLREGLPAGYGLLALLIAVLILEKGIVTYHARLLVRDYFPAKTDFPLRKITPESKKPE